MNDKLQKITLKIILVFSFLGILLSFGCGNSSKAEKTYSPSWESLQKHPMPEWLKDDKFGIYMHWGVYSVGAYRSEWYPHHMYAHDPESSSHDVYLYHKEKFGDPRKVGYKDLIPMFTAEHFDSDAWADLFKKAGARFAGPVAEHHDGFSMWDSEVTEWNAADMGPKRDILGELAKAVRERDMRLVTSFHHSRKWWYYEYSYTPDKRYDTQDPKYAGLYSTPHEPGVPPSKKFIENWLAKIYEVMDNYKPDLLHFDSGWTNKKYMRSAYDDFQENAKIALAHYYNVAEECGKEVIITDKYGKFPKGVGMFNVENRPGYRFWRNGVWGVFGGEYEKIREEPWLIDVTVDPNTWCHVVNPEYKTADELIDMLCDLVSKYGVMMLNVGPKADGTIPEPAVNILLEIGNWLDINGEAIFGTRPWRLYGEGPSTKPGKDGSGEKEKLVYTDKDIRFTRSKKGDVLYVIGLGWPEKNEILIENLSLKEKISSGGISSVSLLGSKNELQWSRNENGLSVRLPEEKPCKHAYAIKIGLKGEMSGI